VGANKAKKSADKKGRFETSAEVKKIVWIRAAGHCELCGEDLTHDFRVGMPMKWGEVAHVMPASPKGPRASHDHQTDEAERLTNDVTNLMLLCPSCHDKIDRDDEGYPKEDLTTLHEHHVEKVRLAATVPADGHAIGLIFLSDHFKTINDIADRELLQSMSAEGLRCVGIPFRIQLPAPGRGGRDAQYRQSVEDLISPVLDKVRRLRGGTSGDQPTLAVVGVADFASLIMLGQALGDRSKRLLFSYERQHRLRWPDQLAEAPEFRYIPPPLGDGPIALVLSISAKIPARDVEAALPGARVAILTIDEPSYSMVRNRSVIHAFRDAVQMQMSELEASTPDAIHLFLAIPAALAIELGALMTTVHQHPYVVYDRDKDADGDFKPVLEIASSN